MGLLFDFAQMEQNRQTVIEVADALARHIEDIDAMVRRIAESWEGQAADRFKTVHAAWRRDAASLHGDLAYLHRILCVSQGNFASADTAVHAMWGGAA